MRINDAKHLCDRCGYDCGNGALTECSVLSTINKVDGMVVNMHFCRDREEDGKTVKGCTGKLLTPKNTEFFQSQQPTEDTEEN